MKNFSIGLNIVLAAAVAFLYVKVFSVNKATLNTPVSAQHAVSMKQTAAAPIAYIELDSLNERIDFIKGRRQELETEQRGIDAEWRNGYAGLESRKNEFLKKGNSITQQDAEKFQNELLQNQQEIDGKKQELMQKLNEKSYKFMDDIQKKLKDFSPIITKTGGTNIFSPRHGLDYMIYRDSTFNITDDVVKGMNEKLGKK